MKKVFLMTLFLLAAMLSWGSNSDLVVLLDVSESMFGEFNTTVNYLIRDVLTDYLRYNDSLHLLTFDENVRVEISKQIQSADDAMEIIDALALIHPFGQYTDLILALETVYSFTNDLPEDTIKNVVILTDGIHDPPPGRYSDDGIARLDELANQLRETGWNISLVELGSDNSIETSELKDAEGFSVAEKDPATTDTLPSSEIGDLSTNLGANIVDPTSEEGLVSITGGILLKLEKNTLKVKDNSITASITAQNMADTTAEFKITAVYLNNRQLAQNIRTITVSPDSLQNFELFLPYDTVPDESISAELRLDISSDTNVKPESFTIIISSQTFNWLWIIIPGGLVLLAVLILIIIRLIPGTSDDDERQNSTVPHFNDDNNEQDSATRKGNTKKSRNRDRSVSQNKDSFKSDNKKKVKRFRGKKTKRKQQNDFWDTNGKNSNNASQADTADKSAFFAHKTSTDTSSSDDSQISDLPKSGKKKTVSLEELSAKKQARTTEEKQDAGKTAKPANKKIEEVNIKGFPVLNTNQNKNMKFLVMLNTRSKFDPSLSTVRAQKLEKGKILTVGAGSSSFYIYFDRTLPGEIAELHYNGKRCSFIPKDFKYFPDLQAPLSDCLNKKIRIIYEGEEQSVTFKEWLSPLDLINRIMRFVDYQGPPHPIFKDENTEG